MQKGNRSHARSALRGTQCARRDAGACQARRFGEVFAIGGAGFALAPAPAGGAATAAWRLGCPGAWRRSPP
eukprot:304628-Lingulodinium_polyedra.AAC.1